MNSTTRHTGYSNRFRILVPQVAMTIEATEGALFEENSDGHAFKRIALEAVNEIISRWRGRRAR